MKENCFLELLELYMDLTEKQDEIIIRFGRLVAKQATELAHLRNLMDLEIDEEMQSDINIVKEVIDEYEKMKNES